MPMQSIFIGYNQEHNKEHSMAQPVRRQFRGVGVELKPLAHDGAFNAAECPQLPVNVEKLRPNGGRQGRSRGSSCGRELATVEYR